MSELFHASTAEVAVTAETAFAYLCDGIKQGEWAIGGMQRERVGDDLFKGVSIFDGSVAYVRLLPDQRQLLIDYEVGPSPERLLRMNAVRVIPGPFVGRGEATCLVTLMKWRVPTWSEEQWRRYKVTFDTEIHIIKGRLEHGL